MTEFRREVLAVPSSVGLLRDLAEVHLRKWGADESFIDDVILVVSELATNSVTHCRGRLMGFEMYASNGGLVVEAWDPSSEPPVPREATGEDLGGRGLAIVDYLAESWGTRWPPRGGKCVWARLVPR